MKPVTQEAQGVEPPRSTTIELAPRISRPGRRFEPAAEQALDPVLRKLSGKLPGSRDGVLIVPEFFGANGVADLVAVTRFSTALGERLDSGVRPIQSLADASVVAALRFSQPLGASAISRRVGTSERQVRERLARLSETGAVRRLGAGHVRHPSLLPIGRLYAFEAKVADWRSAFNQALRYAQWSDAIGVVLLKAPRNTEPARTMAEDLSIGLAIDGRWIVRPRLRSNASSQRLLASERLVATVAGEPAV